MIRHFTTVVLLLITTIAIAGGPGKKTPPAPPAEGMFPLSELSRLDLQAAGLEIPTEEIYNPNGNSLVKALVRLGGCTGSFVSETGLIITNHHCAFGAVAAASTPEDNYLENGFYAANGGSEIRAKGLTCRITESYEDVSAKVLKGSKDADTPEALQELIAANIKTIIAQEKEASPKMTIEISEMFTGKTYVLFRYTVLNDIRLVYVPPRAVGEFGGSTDNWEWPRHTGDFSFVRAYVAPDGSSATYSEENVPYKPELHLKVNPKGVVADDFVFILGYPGRTMRHKPAPYMKYQNEYILPYIAHTFDWLIDKMETLSADDEQLYLSYASRIKSLDNVSKNFKGKMKGLRRTGLIDSKYSEDAALNAFISKNPLRKKRYGDVVNQIHTAYDTVLNYANLNLWYGQLQSNSKIVATASRLLRTFNSLSLLSKKEQKEYLKKEKENIVSQVEKGLLNMNPEFEKDFLNMMFDEAQNFKADEKLNVLNGFNSMRLKELMSKSLLDDPEALIALLKKKPKKFFKQKNGFMSMIESINAKAGEMITIVRRNNARINQLTPSYLEAKSEMKGSSFIPDANGTLRLTYGNIRGYSPADAVYVEPFTTLAGLMEKGQNASSGDDYFLPDVIKEKSKTGPSSAYAHPDYDDVTIGLLYDMDTTGGNSGSPVMDAKGRLIGVNFDRAYTATINDYAWNESYSRSIGVDIRYVLWVLDDVSGANRLLKEMGVSEL